MENSSIRVTKIFAWGGGVVDPAEFFLVSSFITMQIWSLFLISTARTYEVPTILGILWPAPV